MEFYCKLQMDDGHWANDYGGPLFLLPGLVFTCYISGTQIPEPYKIEIIHYLTKQQREDGGWGLYVPSLCLGLRIAGISNRPQLCLAPP